METIRLSPECISCLVKTQLERYPTDTGTDKKIKYMQAVLKIISEAPKSMSAPEIVDKIYDLQEKMFGAGKDYADTKRYFNELMLGLEPEISSIVKKSDNPLKSAIQYAMTGNYIDFAAMENVEEGELKKLLDKSSEIVINEQELKALKDYIISSKKLVYLTDNCGEIVLDKILISVIKELNPLLNITVIVRGLPVVNDATIFDAEQVGLADTVHIMGNGSKIAGTVLDKISYESKTAIESADVIIAKGQANFETLRECGLNIYYIFMCKCKMFADRFNVPLYSGILINDKSVCK